MSITRKILIALIVIILVLGLIGFALSRGDTADLSVDDVAGVEPTLEEADAETIPTVAIAEPVGWDEGELPVAAGGLAVSRFAEGLDHPRVIHTLPNGDVLVTLTRAPQSDARPAIRRMKSSCCAMGMATVSRKPIS